MPSELSQPELDRIAEAFSDSIRNGEGICVDRFLEQYPDSGDELRDVLEAVAMIEGSKRDSMKAGADTPKIEHLDDYRILRELGRGGMGVVFEAIHQSLGRRIALKVLSSNRLDNRNHLARFRREARAAARLRHSNIVPVFGVGQSGEHHYYVMDLIDGLSLKDWIRELNGKPRRELPTIDTTFEMSDDGPRLDSGASDFVDADGGVESPDTKNHFNWVARVGATIADALHYAHGQGVLHRDIKPANLLIDQRKEVWIADFGLAKLSENPTVTMTGDVVGTPQYMPPESFDGRYDVRSEVYNVGLTLYEMLVLRPAIEGKNTGDTLRKATEGVQTSPRKFNAKIPVDLETIVMKSLAHDPELRYQSAGDLADDLQRFLEHRPLAARRASLLQRVTHWSRRDPKVASLTFVTFGLISALAIVSAAGYLRTRQALDEAESSSRSASIALESTTNALQLADTQRALAESNLRVAVEAFDGIMRNVSTRGIEVDAEMLGEVADTTVASVTPEDAELLQSLLVFFDRLAASNREDLLPQSALASRRAGDIYMSLGKLEEADKAYVDALKRYSRIIGNDPGEVASIIAKAEVMNEVAVIASLRGELTRASGMYDPTTELLRRSEAAMATSEGRFQFARAGRLFASISSRSGLDNTKWIPQRIDRRIRGPLTGMMRRYRSRENEALESAVETLGSLIEEFPDDARYQAELARVYRDQARIASRAGRKADAESSVRESINQLEDLLADNPSSAAIQYELAVTLLSSEAFGFHQRIRIDRADELINQLLETSPTLPRYGSIKAQSLTSLALLERRSGRLDKAASHLLEATRLYNALAMAAPELELYESRRLQTLESLADIRTEQGNTDAAIDILDRASRQMQPRLRSGNVSPVTRLQMQRIRQKANDLRTASG
ncbi:MAG: protein kinase [Planctomycetota bacterium]